MSQDCFQGSVILLLFKALLLEHFTVKIELNAKLEDQNLTKHYQKSSPFCTWPFTMNLVCTRSKILRNAGCNLTTPHSSVQEQKHSGKPCLPTSTGCYPILLGVAVPLGQKSLHKMRHLFTKIRSGLCNVMPRVAESASLIFDVLVMQCVLFPSNVVDECWPFSIMRQLRICGLRLHMITCFGINEAVVSEPMEANGGK